MFNNISLNTNINYNYVLTVPTNKFSVLGKNINSATQLRNMIISPPDGFTSSNVLEALYDIKINKENKGIFNLIIKKIKEAYGIPYRNSISLRTSNTNRNYNSHRNSNINSNTNSNNNLQLTSVSTNTKPKTKKQKKSSVKTRNNNSITTPNLRRSRRLRKNK